MGINIALLKQRIEKKLDEGVNKFIIFPFGNIGREVKNFLNTAYGIEEFAIIDSHFSKYNNAIKDINFLKELDPEDNWCVLCTIEKLKEDLLKYIDEDKIITLTNKMGHAKLETKIGRHSYGPLCQYHTLIESIGSFCSFAEGIRVVGNHQMKYLTTSPMLYSGSQHPEGDNRTYDDFSTAGWYMKGVQPKAEYIERRKRITIGNDVWLGANVIITNYANIGNGVIAGAGAIITKDVPDYAVVAGVPARIIKYRYTPEQIAALNKICWWDWSDDEIRERFDDFYLPIEDFIKKYLK